MKISKKIWMRAVILAIIVGESGLIFVSEWFGANLFHMTWYGMTYIETQMYLISKVTPIGYAGILSAIILIGMEMIYRIWTLDEKEVTNE